MGLFGIGKKAPPAISAGTFKFSDGSTFTPEQFGYLAAGVGFQNAPDEIDDIFGKSTLAGNLTLSRAVHDNPFLPTLDISTLDSAVYMWYATAKLRIDSSIAMRVFKGISDYYSTVTDKQGKALTPEKVTDLLQQVRKLAIEIDRDIEANSTHDTSVYRTTPIPSISLLLETIMRHLSSNQAEIEKWKNELLSAPGLLLWSSLEASLLGTQQTVSERLKVSFEN